MVKRWRELESKFKRMPIWKRGLAWLLSFGLLFSLGGFLFAWVGFAPIAASSGHWPVTDWFLHFAMRNAVELRAMGTKQPPMDDPALLLKGAGHYATGCAPCHGAPGEARPVIPRQMTPVPPYLPPKIPQWESQELFWIVKHGVKFTAMPAWPALQREDEVWAMVAFLQQLPELDEARYRELAFGPRADNAQQAKLAPLGGPLENIVADCARCHGSEGVGRGTGAFPILAGQSEDYLFASLRAYARGNRHSGVMQPVAAALEIREMAAVANYYADQVNPGETLPGAESPDAIGRGRSIAENGVPEKGVPSCSDCHGPGEQARNAYYPELAGQYADYLYLQLTLFKSGERGGTPYAHIMHSVAKRLTEEQMRDLANYYASL